MLASWLKFVPYQNLLLGLGICTWVLWVGVQIAKVGAGAPLSPREECRARLEDWFQGQLEANASHASLGLRASLPGRRANTCTATWRFGCLPRRTQVFFAVAPAGSYARSWTELTTSDVGVLAEQFSIGPVDAAPYFRDEDSPAAVCVTQLDADSELDVWSVSAAERWRAGVKVRRGELIHEHDDQPPVPTPLITF